MGECSRRGANPNCFKCGGLGASSLAEPGQAKRKSYDELLSSLQAIAREHCRKRRTLSQSRSRQPDAHDPCPLRQRDGLSGSIFCTCPLCGDSVKAKNLPRHNRKAHSGTRSVGNLFGRLREAGGPITNEKPKRGTPSYTKSKVTQGSNKKRPRGGWFVQGGLCNGR